MLLSIPWLTLGCFIRCKALYENDPTWMITLAEARVNATFLSQQNVRQLDTLPGSGFKVIRVT